MSRQRSDSCFERDFVKEHEEGSCYESDFEQKHEEVPDLNRPAHVMKQFLNENMRHMSSHEN